MKLELVRLRILQMWHLREVGSSRTLCGRKCVEWVVIKGTPEQVECLRCFDRWRKNERD